MPQSAESELTHTCANCGSESALEYCPQCGQRQVRERLTIRLWLHELVEELGWNARIPRTFVALFRTPGLLTQEFLAGRRARWIHPFRLYLLSSFVMFAVILLLRTFASDLPDPTGPLYDPSLVGHTERVNAAGAASAPQALFILVPLFAAFVMILFRKTGLLYFEHLVFALHVHAAAFLLLTVFFVLDKAPDPWSYFLAGPIVLVVLAYLLIALRRVYQQSWIRTGIKGGVLFLVHLTVVAIVIMSVATLRSQTPMEERNEAYGLYHKWTAAHARKDSEAPELLRRAALAHARLELHLADPHTRYHYAKMLSVAGERANAQQWLSEALAQDSSNLLMLGLAAELAATRRDSMAAGGFRDRFNRVYRATTPELRAERFGGQHTSELTAYEKALIPR